MGIRDWSVTASSNGSADPTINFAEGQPANTVNDSARALMAAVAQWRDDTQGALTTTGSANTYLAASATAYTALATGLTIKAKFNAANTGASTLNLDSLGAKALRRFTTAGEVALSANDLVVGNHYILVYDTALNSGAGAWVVTDPAAPVLPITTANIADANVTTAKLAFDGGALSGFRNRIINGNFQINQRAYVSGTATTGANQYTFDRWRVVVSGQSATFTTTGIDTLVTAPAGGLEQVIEGANVEGGTCVLNWTGTATATVNGSAVAKLGTFTLTAGSNATLRFSSGTVGLVQLEPGTVATPFERRPIGIELALCQRYYETGDARVTGSAGGAGGTATNSVSFAVDKRASPTVTFSSQSFGGVATAVSVGSAFVRSVRVDVTSSAAGAFLASFTYAANAEL